jgi:hypothetical protein
MTKLFVVKIGTKDKCLGYHSVWRLESDAVRVSEKLNLHHPDMTYSVAEESPEREIIDWNRRPQVKLKHSIGFMNVY